MLKNRAFAWVMAVAVMALSVFAGVYTTYAGMRNAALSGFHGEVVPIVHEAMVPAFNMQRVAESYLSDAEVRAIGIGRIVSDIQAADDPARIYDLFTELNRGVWAVYDRLADMEISDANRTLLINFHADFMAFDRILSRAGYNNTARDFNEALDSNLGFLVRPFIGDLPRFD